MNCFKFALLVALFGGCESRIKAPALSEEHQKALASLEVMAGFEVEMVAAEPLVQDPVAMEIDEQGRLFVVEMPGYPLDLGKSGRVKLLQDTNHDGYPDTSVVFADGLTLPTGIMRWKNGIVVTDAPDVLYLEDTNGDNRADVRKVLLTGFALSNPQHNLNTPVLGIDNWIYLAHESSITPFVYRKEFGDEGSEIRFPDRPDAPKLDQNASGRNVRFKPDTHELEALSGETQFGQTFDPWGHHLLTANANHLFHEVLAARYIKRNPHLLVPDATQNIPDHGDAAEVYPITENPSHQLLTDAGVITSSCGVTWYTGGQFGDAFKNVTFIAEPTHNLVHADVIKENGASFVASRLLEKKEFLASKDAWFRPVNFYVGPDGALYVIDYYRQNIEHPEWMSEEMTKSGALYNGKDKGRIYRITPKNGLPMNWLNALKINEWSNEDLVGRGLDSPNGWLRRTAQRLLLDRRSAATVAPLRGLITHAKNPEAKVQALWLLETMAKLDESILQIALKDPTAGVRENAVKLLENSILKTNNWALLDKITAGGANDVSAKVRYQWLCTLGNFNTASAQTARMAILTKDIEDKWVGLAAITAAAGHESDLLALASQKFGSEASEAKATFFTYLGATIANSGRGQEVKKLLTLTTQPDRKLNDWWKAATLAGITKLWQYRGLTVPIDDADKAQLLAQFNQKTSPKLLLATLNLLEITGLPNSNAGKIEHVVKTAQSWATNAQLTPDTRTAAVKLLALQNPKAHRKLLEQLAIDPQSDPVRLVAFESLGKDNQANACSFALKEWKKLSPTLKSEAVSLFMQSPGQSQILLEAIDQNRINRSDLAWPQMVHLMNYDDTRVRAYARKVLAINENRKVVVQQYEAALNLKGTKARGQAVFAQMCNSCHQIGQTGGIAFGPDLSSLRNRNSHSILTEILHPNNSIADGYDYYTVTYLNGKQVAGILKNETNAALTIRQAGGGEVVVARTDVKSAQKSAQSVGEYLFGHQQPIVGILGFREAIGQ
jgi:putative membrane-bound dehydrogenase-like protein